MAESLFQKRWRSQPANLLKKRLWHRCFPLNFAKLLRTPFFTEYFRATASVCREKLHSYLQMVIYVEASCAGSLFNSSSQLPSDTKGKFTFFYTRFLSRTPTIQVK